MTPDKPEKPYAPETLRVHAGGRPEEAFRSLTTPVYLTSTFRLEDSGGKGPYYYSRYANPTRTSPRRPSCCTSSTPARTSSRPETSTAARITSS